MDEKIMQRWDEWRKYISEGGTASWPRDEFESLIDGYEERIELAEATRDDALAYAKGYKSELAKWISSHEDSELQRMKEQSQQPSLSAKQAYINALQWTLKHLELRVKELEEGLRNAYEVIDYSGGGDAWEKEATEKERDRFYEIYDKLIEREDKDG